MTKSKTTSWASRSKKWSPSTSPARPCSMIRKNGSRARKSLMSSLTGSSLRLVGNRQLWTVLVRPNPVRRGASSEVRKGGGQHASHALDVIVGPGAITRRDGLGQHREHAAVLSGNARGDVLDVDERLGA